MTEERLKKANELLERIKEYQKEIADKTKDFRVNFFTDDFLKDQEEAFKDVKGGEIAIIHFNHPESQTREGIIRVIKKLKKEGYTFVKLSDYSLK